MADGGRSNEDVAMRLTALMTALKLNQSSFARLIGISPPAFNNYLATARRPDIEVAIQIQAKTGATLDWLYLGERAGLPSALAQKLPDLSAPARKGERQTD